MKLQLLEAVKNICRMPTFAVPADLCFAIGHHRIRYPLDTEPEMAVLNRMELSATVIREGWCSSTGQLGMLPYKNGPTKRYYRDVCTGSALVKLAKSRGVELQYSELIESPGNPVVKEWLACAVPSFAQAIYSGVVMYEPCRVIIDGVFNVMPERVRKHLVDLVTKELTTNGLALPRICLFHGDDLMGARGAAFIARDRVADDVITQVLQS
jgi:predicted NBD/HSP70 family sugar kinase